MNKKEAIQVMLAGGHVTADNGWHHSTYECGGFMQYSDSAGGHINPQDMEEDGWEVTTENICRRCKERAKNESH